MRIKIYAPTVEDCKVISDWSGQRCFLRKDAHCYISVPENHAELESLEVLMDRLGLAFSPVRNK